jgi:hypothetical protein
VAEQLRADKLRFSRDQAVPGVRARDRKGYAFPFFIPQYDSNNPMQIAQHENKNTNPPITPRPWPG